MGMCIGEKRKVSSRGDLYFGCLSTHALTHHTHSLLSLSSLFQLIIDSELGYRDREASNGRNVIPPNTDLIYEIELVDINNSKDEL